MQVILLSCLFGVVCGMGLWVAVSAQATVDEMMRRSGKPLPPEER
jgi:Na+-transporting NADH:ubiquinone oxidoreductase subunit NqrE